MLLLRVCVGVCFMMELLVILCGTMLAVLVAGEDNNRWVWSGSGRSLTSPVYPEESAQRPLYRPPAPVYETVDYTRPPPLLPPTRPVINRPQHPGPPPGAPGILTGPVPSWEQGREDKFAYKDYETCKCVYGFNCISPGIKFGHCDEGKQYCCYNAKENRGPGYGSGVSKPPPFINNNNPNRPPPGLPIDNNRRPGGGYGGIGNGNYDRPSVLVGPGGPTGIVGGGNGPFGGPEEDLFQNRPGYGPFVDDNFPRPPYNPLARSVLMDSKKNGKKL